MVKFNSDFFTNDSGVVPQGEGWGLAADGTVTVTGATTGASIMYVYYSKLYNETTLPFYLQHAITFVAITVLLAVVAVGVFLRFRVHKSKPSEAQR